MTTPGDKDTATQADTTGTTTTRYGTKQTSQTTPLALHYLSGVFVPATITTFVSYMFVRYRV